MFRPLLGLTVLAAAAAPAWAGQIEIETAAPIQAVTQAFPNEKGVLAYYTPEAGRCDLVLMMVQELAPRIRVTLAPDQAATVEDVSGGAVKVTCGAGAERLLVERTAPAIKAASAE